MLCSLRIEKKKDWIAQGTLLLYYLRERYTAQKPPFFSSVFKDSNDAQTALLSQWLMSVMCSSYGPGPCACH